MAHYVDGFVVPVPLKDDEVVVFSWIVYKSREDGSTPATAR